MNHIFLELLLSEKKISKSFECCSNGLKLKWVRRKGIVAWNLSKWSPRCELLREPYSIWSSICEIMISATLFIINMWISIKMLFEGVIGNLCIYCDNFSGQKLHFCQILLFERLVKWIVIHGSASLFAIKSPTNISFAVPSLHSMAFFSSLNTKPTFFCPPKKGKPFKVIELCVQPSLHQSENMFKGGLTP